MAQEAPPSPPSASSADALLRLLVAVTRAANEARSLEEAFSRALGHLCDHTGWPVGHAYLADPATGELASSGVWRLPERDTLAEFRELARTMRFAPGVGVLGRVMITKEPAWLEDTTADPEFLRAPAAAGLHAGFMVPVLVGDDVVGVVECFTDRPAPRDDALLSILPHVGIQLGRAVERARAHSALSETETRLRAHSDALARTNAELEQFAHAASHDLQEPLRMVALYTRMLQRRYQGKLDAQADRYIEFAVEGAERMNALITDLLALSRVATHGRDPVPIDAGVPLARALRTLGPEVVETGAEVTTDPMPNVVADARQLEDVFRHLLGNALKFRRPDVPARIHVSACVEDDAVHFAVRDNGIGIDPVFAEQIFVLFQRLHTRSEYPGTGIGLAICRKIVERHGGRIWVESAPDAGATFHFTLPR